MNYLGLDYGAKKIGVALAAGPLAQPLATINTSKALDIISTLAEKHAVKAIIIGLPDGPLKQQVKKFIDELRNLNFELIVVDETLSSHDALMSLRHTGQRKRARL
ncbi:hypothetical protein A2702_00985, partial [Candidatus Amesbacteria bacterium RIFCSPHIGHO2_01_FULL_48_75]